MSRSSGRGKFSYQNPGVLARRDYSSSEGVFRGQVLPRGSPDGAGEVARAQGRGRGGEPEFIFSCLECASKPYLDIRRQGELEAAGAGEEIALSPSGAPLTLLFPARPLILLSGGSGAAVNSSPCWRGRCPVQAGLLPPPPPPPSLPIPHDPAEK